LPPEAVEEACLEKHPTLGRPAVRIPLAPPASRYGIRTSAALNSEVCDHHPKIIEAGGKLGWEWIGHNQTNALRLTEMDTAPEPELAAANAVVARTAPRANG
jgi:hypothetical protein